MSTRTLFCLLTFFVIILLVSTCSNAQAQNLYSDINIYSIASIKSINQFNSAMGERQEIYNGPAYELLPPGNKGSFYFQDKNYCTPAAIKYDGTWYKNIPMMYDVHNDVMVSVLNSSFYILRTDKLSDVIFADHHFMNLATANQLNLPAGFYDMLYSGNSQLIAKRSKVVRDENMGTQGVGYVYEDHTDLYVKRGDRYIEVNSKSALLDILADRKKLLNQYLQDNHINYSNDKEIAAIKLAAYYDSLTK